jgi:hypothetical protein
MNQQDSLQSQQFKSRPAMEGIISFSLGQSFASVVSECKVTCGIPLTSGNCGTIVQRT